MTETSSPRGLRLHIPLLVTAGIVLILDQVSKAWAHGDWGFDGFDRCADQFPRPTVDLCLAFNEGMAFSIGWGGGALIAPIAFGIVIMMLAFAPKMTPLQRIMMGAISGGAIGNLIDRAVRTNSLGEDGGFMGGAVVDFVYSRFFATFNVADAAIVVGGILLAITVWRMPDPDEEAAVHAAASAPLTPNDPTPSTTARDEASNDT